MRICQHKAGLAAGLLAMFLLSFSVRVLAQDQAEPQLIVYKTTTDAQGNEVQLNLHVFYPEGWAADDQRPAIVFFHGGAWNSGRPHQFHPHCRELAARGMVAASAEYRVRNVHGTPPQACVEDGKSAVRYMRAHADELGINPDMLAAGGGSAGGHVAACTGVVRGFDAEGEDVSISSTPNLMVLFNPVVNTAPRGGFNGSRLGEDAVALSPTHQAHAGQPPSILFHGDADTIVSIEHARGFLARSIEVGAQCQLIEYAGAGHSFFNHSSFRRQREGEPDYYALTTQAMFEFLHAHGYIAEEAE